MITSSGVFFFNQLAGLLYRFVHIPAAAADSILVGRYAEEQDSGNTQLNNLVNTFHNAVDGPVVVAGQRFDFMFNVFAGNDEKADRLSLLRKPQFHGSLHADFQ